MIFLEHLQQIDKMAKWAKDAIQTYQLTSTSLIDEDLVHLSVPPSFTCLAYKKMKAYGNHFWVDDEQNSLLVTYDLGVTSIF
jgi:hypothetical protein